MNFVPRLRGISTLAEQRARLFEAVLVIGGAIAVAYCVLVPKVGLVVVIACTAGWFLGLVGHALRGRLDGILLWWTGAFPLGYYFLSFPREHSIVTLDRVVVLVAFMGLFLVKPSALTAVPTALRQAGLAGLAFAAVAGVSLLEPANVVDSVHKLLGGVRRSLLLWTCGDVGGSG